MKLSQGILNNQTIYLGSTFAVLWAAPIFTEDVKQIEIWVLVVGIKLLLVDKIWNSLLWQWVSTIFVALNNFRHPKATR